MHTLSGNIVDVVHRTIFPGTVTIRDGKIAAIERQNASYDTFLLPGFIDAHVHVESSLLVPSEFARLAVVHGTVATVSDPHEIGNVLGAQGVLYMIENARKVPFKFHFGAPSCVPATSFERAGAAIDAAAVDRLLDRPDIGYLSEVMNVPGVVHGDPGLMAKIDHARRRGKPVDGHAPGLRGEDLAAYVRAGITTDHECVTYDEALEKLGHGMRIAIREGSAAKNFDELVDLIPDYPDRCMFCSDDKHPDALMEGHINELVRRAIARGIDRMDVLQCACVNPVRHYDLDVGLLQEGDSADLIEIDGFEQVNVLHTFIDGRLVARSGETQIPSVQARTPNTFEAAPINPPDLAVPAAGERMRVIEAVDGQLITRQQLVSPTTTNGTAVADPDRDLLKIAVINRYIDQPPAVGFITGFGLKRGAIASSVAHDSHNVVAVGTSDESLCRAINAVIEQQGGLSLADGDETTVLPLPVAGLMTTEDGFDVAERYTLLDRKAKQALGATLSSPYMALSFMALLVIPELKLSDKGLFDGNTFQFTPLFVDH